MRLPFRKTAGTLLLVSVTSLASAAEWKIDPTVKLKVGYNDNIRMGADDELSSPVVILSPSATFSVATPRSGTRGDLRVNFRRFTEESDLDDDNIYFRTHTYHRLERSTLGLDADFVRDTTLDSQLDDTGVVLGRVKRHRYNLGPSWTWNYDERTNLLFGYDYSNVKYEGGSSSGFVDFHTNTFRTSMQHALNERTTVSTTLSYRRTSNDNKVDTTNTNLQAGGSYRFSETLSANLFGGLRHTRAEFSQNSQVPIFDGDTIIGFRPVRSDESQSDWGYTFSGGVDKSFLRGRSSLSASRSINNSINGVPIEVTRAGLKNLYRFSETWSTELNLAAYRSQTSADARNGNRKYYQVEPKVNWQFRQFWRLSGSYRYRKQTFDNTGDDATQNVAYLTLTYLWPRIAVSR